MNGTVNHPTGETPWGGFGVMFLQFAGLATFAAVGPFLSLLQTGPTFLVAQGLSGTGLVVYVVAWLVLPAAVLASVVWTLGRWRASAGSALRTVVVGVFAGLAIVGVLPGSLNWSSWVFIAAWVATGIAAGVAFARFGLVRSLLTASSVAVPVFAIGFLASAPVRPLLAPVSATAEEVTRSENPVVFIVFDELGLGTILTPEGDVNGTLFPNFARLAETSTWYSEATTVAPATALAVPALLTGQFPTAESVPSSSDWPRNLFTLLGGGDRVLEFATALCPTELCDGPGVDLLQLVRDSGSVLVNAVVPRDVAGWVVPPIDEQWTGFGGDETGDGVASGPPANPGQADAGEVQASAVKRIRERVGGDGVSSYAAAFLDSLPGLGAGDLAYAHFSLPHPPLTWVADGTRYNGGRPAWFAAGNGQTGVDPPGQITTRQRLVLQTMFVDRILGEILDALEQQGVLDEALLVVASDHGMTTEPGTHRRGHGAVSPIVYDDAIPVPLFIKAPGQETGVVDSRDARTMDVLPTIIDLLGITGAEDWEFEGVSLAGAPVEGRPRLVAVLGELPGAPSAVASAQRQWLALGPAAANGAIYAIGPHAGLVGRSVDDPAVRVSLGTALNVPVDPWRDIDLESGELPLLVSIVEPAGLTGGDWAAVAVNGTVAGVGPAFIDGKGQLRVEAMVDPSTVRDGANALQAFAIISPEASGSPP